MILVHVAQVASIRTVAERTNNKGFAGFEGRKKSEKIGIRYLLDTLSNYYKDIFGVSLQILLFYIIASITLETFSKSLAKE